MRAIKGNNNIPKVFFFVLIIIISIFIAYRLQRKEEKSPENLHIVAAKLQASNVNLYYSGVTQPLKTYNVVSPVDGIIKKNYFHYGSEVLKNQLLAEISSVKIKQDYASALTNYIKDKDQYLKNKRTLEATTALYKAEIIDKETYLNDTSQFKISQLAYINTQNSLKEIIKNMPGEHQNIEELELKNIEDVQDILAKTPDEFKVYAPFNGTLLMPQKSDDSAVSGSKVLDEGSEIKKYQTLVALGDMSGVSTTIYVSEMDINQIAIGQTATLTNPALPGIILYGKVTEVSRQAKQDAGSGGVASFPVHIAVPQLSDAQHRLIRVGMTLKVNIILHDSPQIKVPLKTVFEKNDHHMVDVWDIKTRTIHSVIVKTGATGLSDVAILEGIKPGDYIVVHD